MTMIQRVAVIGRRAVTRRVRAVPKWWPDLDEEDVPRPAVDGPPPAADCGGSSAPRALFERPPEIAHPAPRRHPWDVLPARMG